MAASAAILHFRGRRPPRSMASMSWTALLLALMPLVWLMPQHYLPWLAAHQEAAAWALTGLAALVMTRARTALSMPTPWLAATVLALASVAWQSATGRIVFLGDAVVTAAVLLTFLLGIAAGSSIAAPGASTRGPDGLALGVVAAAILSVAVALMQWTDTRGIPLPVARLLPGDRPYANLAQANHFSTICFLGLCALAWLRETGRIGRAGLWVGGGFLVLGLLLGGSRTAWLQLAAATTVVALVSRRTGGLVTWRQPLAACVWLGGLTLAWPWLNATVGLQAGRTLAEAATQPDMRTGLWWQMLLAAWQGPWDGWGWRQMPAAQLATALDHPHVQRYFDHAHNTVLDLMVWAGPAMGLAITACAGWGLAQVAARLRDASATWMLIAVLGLVLHGMVEYPLDYAYFLLPFGVLLGVLHASSAPTVGLPTPRWAIRGAATLSLATLGLVATDYLTVEQDYRTVRLESTFGERRITTPLPELRVLDQMHAYLSFIRTPARGGMSADELAGFEAVAARFAHPPVLLRLALAQGLNGRSEAATQTLRQLCAIHTPQRCTEGRESWLQLQALYPVLAPIAPPPVPSH